MAAPNIHIPEIIIAFCALVLLLPVNAISADTPPTEDIINHFAENAKLTANTFMQQSFKLRMQYEYSGKFLTEADKKNLYELAENAGDKLRQIIENQEALKQRIEDYQGDDWDRRYGSTGLWRKLSTDIYTAKLNKFEIDYYLALASEQKQQDSKLHLVLREIDTLIQSSTKPGPNLIRGKTLALLAQTDPSYKDAAAREFEQSADYPEIYYSTAALIEKIKLLDHPDTNRLNTLAKKLSSNWDDRYSELILSLMFLQRRYDPDGFEKTLSFWPQTQDLIASLALSDLTHRLEHQQNLHQISITEAELAALAAWKNQPQNHKNLLSRLSSTEKFQTPLILYVTAIARAESSPAEAINLLIRASKSQQQKTDRLNITPGKIAEQAAQLAYNLFITDFNCPLALGVFDNYYAIAGEEINEELEYLYTIVLNNCGQSTKAKEILKKIANRPSANKYNRAKLDLILQEIVANPQRQNELLEKLGDFILSCHGQDEKNNELRLEALNVYCPAALEAKDKTSAEKALEILTNAEPTAGINIDLFKAQALQQLGRLDESAHYMLLAVQDDSGPLAGKVLELLAEVIDKIDEFEKEPNNPYSLEMMENCKKLAQFSYSTLSDRQSALFLAEISLLTADKNKEKLSEADKLLETLSADNDLDFLRCRARLLSEQSKFDEAAQLWAEIAQTQKSLSAQANRQNQKWWRAKYYELYCWSQSHQTKSEEVLHTIEVLENSFTDIPSFWAEKLNSLKDLCRNNVSKSK